jgi:hypothetical protein
MRYAMLFVLFAVGCGGAAVAPRRGAASIGTGCQADTKGPGWVRRVDVRIAADTCVEDRDYVYGNGEYATLDCSSGGAGSTFRVFLARKEWQDIKRDGTGIVDAGPGK